MDLMFWSHSISTTLLDMLFAILNDSPVDCLCSWKMKSRKSLKRSSKHRRALRDWTALCHEAAGGLLKSKVPLYLLKYLKHASFPWFFLILLKYVFTFFHRSCLTETDTVMLQMNLKFSVAPSYSSEHNYNICNWRLDFCLKTWRSFDSVKNKSALRFCL